MEPCEEARIQHPQDQHDNTEQEELVPGSLPVQRGTVSLRLNPIGAPDN